jgi:hypothetical protein
MLDRIRMSLDNTGRREGVLLTYHAPGLGQGQLRILGKPNALDAAGLPLHVHTVSLHRLAVV